MHQGSCLCGDIRFQFNDMAGDFVICHCRSCRKSSGAAGAINIAVRQDEFHLQDPENRLTTYASSPGKIRHFCGRCGSPLYTRVGEQGEYVRIRLGSLDTEISQQPAAHIFMAHRAAWDDPDTRLPRYDEWPDLKLVDIRGATRSQT